MIANIDSFSDLYPCPTINGTATITWCCEGASVGCCNGSTVWEPDLGEGPLVIALANATNSNPSTLPPSSPQFATSPSPVASSISLIASEPAPTPTNTPAEPSSNPPQPSRRNVALGTGLGVSVGASLFIGLVILFVRERRLRICAQKMTDPFRAAQGLETDDVQSYEMHGPSFVQELDHVEHRPEILSQEVYEANGGS